MEPNGRAAGRPSLLGPAFASGHRPCPPWLFRKPPHVAAALLMIPRMTQGQTAPAGWYPHPEMASTLRYWDGQAWTEHIAPAASKPSAPAPLVAPQAAKQSQIVAALVMVGGVVGLVMSMQSASLLTGTGGLWTGVAIACAAAIASLVMRDSTPRWARVVAVVLAVVAIVNVSYVESQLEAKRQEITNLLK